MKKGRKDKRSLVILDNKNREMVYLCKLYSDDRFERDCSLKQRRRGIAETLRQKDRTVTKLRKGQPWLRTDGATLKVSVCMYRGISQVMTKA